MKESEQTLVRPALNKRLSIEDFRSFYWLKKELLEFCRENGLPTSGGKREVQNRIELFLAGSALPAEKLPRRKPKQDQSVSQSIEFKLGSVIPAHFRCSWEAREFLTSHAGSGFKYTVRLQRYLKVHPGITFADLILEWKRQQAEKRVGLKSNIDPQFEYNQFTRDYFADPNNKGRSRAECIEAWNAIKKIRGNRKYKG